MSPEQLLEHADSGALWSAEQQASLPAELAEAYPLALAVRRLREARGEQARGYKIGFTNSQIWPRYQVFGPIWGTVFSSTLALCDGQARVSLQRAAQPRLEPEAVFGMKATPPQNASADELFACIDWMAPGFEIVQSHAPGWKFTAAMTVADGGLHSRLVVGRPVKVAGIARDAEAFNAVLAACTVRLHKNGQQAEAGHLLLVQHLSLRGFEFRRALGDMALEFQVQLLELARLAIELGEHLDLRAQYFRHDRHRHVIDRAHLVAA